MSWIMLVVAGLLEVVWAYSMKLSAGFTKPGASVVTIVAMLASFALLAASMKTLPLGTAYAVWTGIGTIGTAIAGMILFREPATAMRLMCIALIVAGIAGLKIATPDK